MPSAISVVTLLTDFGDRDYFVASMKGVILGINTQVRILDLSHHITPHCIEEAAFFLKSCYQYFPDGTIHVVVVDPGVGSIRRPLLVSTSRYFFVAPDNGVLSHIYDDEELSVEVREIENKQYRLDSEGATFDGRDVFAPAAAWLTRGQVPGSYGRLIRDYKTLSLEEPQIRGKVLAGRIMYVDHFGNLISNIKPYDLQSLRDVTKNQDISVHMGSVTIEGIKANYGEGSQDAPQALINSNGNLEIFLKEGHAARCLEAKVGDSIEIT